MYDSTDYLKAYKDSLNDPSTDFRRYPNIHDSLFYVIESRGIDGTALDLCCSTGLLGQRIINEMGKECIGVEGNPKSIADGLEYGITMPITEMMITPETFGTFTDLIKAKGVKTLIARRAIPEILGDGASQWAKDFVAGIKEAGITRVYLQGRHYSARSSHPLASINHEEKVFLGTYHTWYTDGQVKYMNIDPVQSIAGKPAPKNWTV